MNFRSGLSIQQQAERFVEGRGFKRDERLSNELHRPIYRDPFKGRYPCELSIAVIAARGPEYAGSGVYKPVGATKIAGAVR